MLKNPLSLAIAAILIPIGSGCTSVEYRTVPLPLPERPVLEAIQPHALECLDQSVYEALVKRQLMTRQYAEELELIIKSTRRPL